MKTSITVTAVAFTTLLACAFPAHAQLVGGGISGAAGGALNGGLTQGGFDGSAIGRGMLSGNGQLDSNMPERLGRHTATAGRAAGHHAGEALQSTRDRTRAVIDETGARATAAKSTALSKSSEVGGGLKATGDRAVATAGNAAAHSSASLDSDVNAASEVSGAIPAVPHDAPAIPSINAPSIPATNAEQNGSAAMNLNRNAETGESASSGSVNASASGDSAGKASVAASASASATR